MFLFGKYYPDIYKSTTKKLSVEEKPNELILKIKQKVFDQYLINNENVLVSGDEAYNYYKDLSKYNKKYFIPRESEEFTIVVKNLKKETKNIISLLGKKDTIIEEYYGYAFLLDRSILIKYKGDNLIRLYASNNTCIQYNTIQLDNGKDNLQIVSHNYLMGYFNCMKMFYKKNVSNRNKFSSLFHYLNDFKNYYLDKNKLIGYEEDNPFNYFRLDCLWENRSINLIRRMYFNERYEKGKKARFEYRPKNNFVKHLKIKFPYVNNSGSEIKDKRHKIFK